jgi:hypothetical protein
MTEWKTVALRGLSRAWVTVRTPWFAGFAVVLFVAAFLRGSQLGWELPHLHHSDEANNFERVQGLLRTGDANPHFFRYPSLSIYLPALLRVVLGWFGFLADPVAVAPPLQFALGASVARSSDAVVAARFVPAALGTGTALLAFVGAAAITGRVGAGVVAGLLVATSPTAIRYSRILTPDMFGAFFACGTAVAAIYLFRSGRRAHYVLAGALAGLAASGKYNALAVLVVPVVAHLLRVHAGNRSWKTAWQGVVLLGAVAAGVFALANPFLLLNVEDALRDIGMERKHYNKGQAGAEGDAVLWYLRCLWSVEGGTLALAVVALYEGVRHRIREVLALGLYLVVYLALVSTFEVRNTRTLLPVLAIGEVLAAVGLYRIALEPGLRRRVLLPFVGGLFVAAALIRAYPAVEQARLSDKVPGDLAAAWIRENVPEGTKIAIEGGGPILEERRDDLVTKDFLHQRSLREYRADRVELFVVSTGGKYKKGRHRARATLYRELTEPERQVVRFETPDLDGAFASLVGAISEPYLQSASVGYDMVGAASCTVYRAPWSRSRDDE